MKRLTWLATALLVASACSPQASPSLSSQPSSAPSSSGVAASVGPQSPTGTLTVMIPSFGNERFDYTFAAGTGTDYAQLLHCFLVTTDTVQGQRTLVPGVATKWDLSADGLTWTFTIRKGVKFHDGTELTAEDVLWTLRHAIGPDAVDYTTSGGQTLALEMKSIEQTAPDQVSVTTKEPIFDLPVTLSEAGGQWIAMMPKRAALRDEQAETAYDQNPIGCGPMKLVKHVAASSMTFERFADHYYQPTNGLPSDRRVKFATLELLQVPEEATRVAALQAGQADIAVVSLDGRAQVESGGGHVIFGQEGVAFEIQGLGCWKPEFACSDRRVRQALAYAINKEAIQSLYGPEVMQPKGWFSVTPDTIGYTQALDPYPFDPAKARQLLADAGYPEGKGFGKLVINTWTSNAIPSMPDSAQLAADNWKTELGLDVSVNVGDEAAIKETYKTTEKMFGQYLWKDQETRFDAAGNLRQAYGTVKADKLSRAHNDQALADLVKEATGISDPAQRTTALANAYLRMRDEAYHIGLGYLNIPWGVSARVASWEPLPFAVYVSAPYTITLRP